MSDKLKRRFLKFRLSTAMLAMLTAGGLLSANCFEQHPILVSSNSQSFGGPTKVNAFQWASFYGWPVGAVIGKRQWITQMGNEKAENISLPQEFAEREPSFFVIPLVLDVLVAVALISCVCVVAEYIIRRREVRKS